MAILTVNGIIKKEELGVTLPHEHIFVDLGFAFNETASPKEKSFSQERLSIEKLHLLKSNPGLFRDNLFLDDENLAVAELKKFKEFGGASIIDQTSIGASPKREKIKAISNATDLNVIAGTGFYVKQSLPGQVVNSSIDELAGKMIEEFETGIGGTGARTGIIGELGLSPEIGDWETRLLKAAAKTQKQTGLAISIHIQAVPTVPDFKGGLNGLEALRILEKTGADISRTAICHTDAKTDPEYLKNIAKSGAFVEFDHFGKDFYYVDADFLMDRDADRVIAIKSLIDEGYLDRILISQDVCLKTDLISYGGFGYAHILRDVVPMMKNKGITLEQLTKIMIENPANLLDIQAKYL